MSFEAIEQEIVSWDDSRLRKLQALVVSPRVRQEDPSFVEKMERRIEDKSPDAWVSSEEFGRRLGLADE